MCSSDLNPPTEAKFSAARATGRTCISANMLPCHSINSQRSSHKAQLEGSTGTFQTAKAAVAACHHVTLIMSDTTGPHRASVRFQFISLGAPGRWTLPQMLVELYTSQTSKMPLAVAVKGATVPSTASHSLHAEIVNLWLCVPGACVPTRADTDGVSTAYEGSPVRMADMCTDEDQHPSSSMHHHPVLCGRSDHTIPSIPNNIAINMVPSAPPSRLLSVAGANARVRPACSCGSMEPLQPGPM